MKQLNGSSNQNGQIILQSVDESGNTLTLAKSIGGPVGGAWIDLTVDLSIDGAGAPWQVAFGGGNASEGQIREVLANLTDVLLRADFVSDPSGGTPTDVTALDSVIMSAPGRIDASALRDADAAANGYNGADVSENLAGADFKIIVDAAAGTIQRFDATNTVEATDTFTNVESIVATDSTTSSMVRSTNPIAPSGLTAAQETICSLTARAVRFSLAALATTALT